mmetsp:Transcript_49603/g.114976  ORF Transcript_49603/g.114976 Transcript_49603/m.114976 type:complete len:112 (-) Transcript_49603:85-420(-)
MAALPDRDFILETVQGLAAWCSDPANDADMKEVKEHVLADESERKKQAKRWIVEKMVARGSEGKSDARFAAFKDDVTPLLQGIRANREDPEVAAALEKVKQAIKDFGIPDA